MREMRIKEKKKRVITMAIVIAVDVIFFLYICIILCFIFNNMDLFRGCK